MIALLVIFVRSGSVNYYSYISGFGYQQRGTYGFGWSGYAWSSSAYSGGYGSGAYSLKFNNSTNSSDYSSGGDKIIYRYFGYSLRCLAS